MMMPLDRALLLTSLAAVGCLALSGTPGLVAAVVVVVAILLRSRMPRVRDWTLGHLLVIVICAGASFTIGLVGAFSILLGWLAAHRVLILAGRNDQRVLLLLATLMVLVGSVGTLSIALAPGLLVYALATPIAFLRIFGVQERKLEVALGVSTALLAAAFFVLVPRLQGSLIGGLDEGASTNDFADDVTLGDESSDPNRRELVLRATAVRRDGSEERGPLYFRGTAFDQFDGRAWSSSGRVRRVSSGSWELRTSIMLEPLQGSAIFGPPDTLYASSSSGPMMQRQDGSLDHGQPGRRVAYEVYSRTRGLENIEDRSRALVRIPTLDPAIVALAESISPGETDPVRLAVAMTRWFADGFTYTSTPGAPVGDPLRWFLLESRTGHCEYFASALAVMLRVRGVPARLATGFYSGEYNEAGGYIAVRRGNAHAWVEVPVLGGWAVLDATPVGELPEMEVSVWQAVAETAGSAWLSLVLDYDLSAQFEGLARLGSLVVTPASQDALRTQTRASLAGAGLVFLALMGSGTLARLLIWWLSRPPRNVDATDAILADFAQARKIVKKRGWPLPDHLPPVESGLWLEAEVGNAGRPLSELAWLLYRTRYAGEKADQARIKSTLLSLRQLPQRPKALPTPEENLSA